MTISLRISKANWNNFLYDMNFKKFYQAYKHFYPDYDLENVFETLLLNYNKGMFMSYGGIALTMYYNNSSENLLEFNLIAKVN